MNVFLRKKIEQVKFLIFGGEKRLLAECAAAGKIVGLYWKDTSRGRGAHSGGRHVRSRFRLRQTGENPGPDHPITLTRHPARVVVRTAGQTLADSRNVLILQEATYPPVFYFPREDVNRALLQKNEHVSCCPYRGDCSYFSLVLNGAQEANVAWSYEMPYNAVVAIKDYLAFYPDKVTEIRTEA